MLSVPSPGDDLRLESTINLRSATERVRFLETGIGGVKSY